MPLIGRLVACSARTRAERQTDRQTDRTTTVTLAAPRVNNNCDPPNGTRSFVSVERMRLLLDIDSVAGTEPIESRQQITPDHM